MSEPGDRAIESLLASHGYYVHYTGRGVPRMGPRPPRDPRDRVRWFLWLCALAGALVLAVIGFLNS